MPPPPTEPELGAGGGHPRGLSGRHGHVCGWTVVQLLGDAVCTRFVPEARPAERYFFNPDGARATKAGSRQGVVMRAAVSSAAPGLFGQPARLMRQCHSMPISPDACGVSWQVATCA
jgi:hypothetical protein